jgi:hypothetical protein
MLVKETRLNMLWNGELLFNPSQFEIAFTKIRV